MPKLKFAALALITMAAVAQPVAAQQFSFTPSGCFYFGAACSPFGNPTTYTLPGSTESSLYQISYSGAPVTGTPNLSGLLGPFNLGAISFTNNTTNTYVWENLKFDLKVNFSQPTSTAPNPFVYSTTLVGSINKDSQGNLSWLFSPDGALFTYPTSGAFTMTIDNSNPNNTYVNTAQLTARIQCKTGSPGDTPTGVQYVNSGCAPSIVPQGPNTTVPEPSTYALMAAGLAGLFTVARRRKADA